MSFLNWKGSRRRSLRFWPTFPGAVQICCIRGPCTPFFSPSSSVSFSPFFLPAHDTQQNSFLFYLHAHFSGRACRHHHLLVINYLLLVSTTRQNMPAAQNSLPFINVNVATDMRKTSLPNLSYPIRPTHTPWVESSVPLVITVRHLH